MIGVEKNIAHVKMRVTLWRNNMNDLAQELRKSAKATFYDPLKSELNRAADRIEELEAALRRLTSTCDCWAAVEECGKARELLGAEDAND
jgi:hypothetical protein